MNHNVCEPSNYVINTISIMCLQPLMPAAQMVLFVWLVVKAVLRGQWRSVIAESGVLSVMTDGAGLMLQWSANSWDSREQVGCELETMKATYLY